MAPQQNVDIVQWLSTLLADPTFAYVLLVIGLTALLVELSFPGQILPGAVGVILMLVSLYLFGRLPVDLAGVLLVVVAFVLLAAEVLAPGFGGFGVAGMAALAIGSLILTQSPAAAVVSSPVAVAVVLAFGGFVAFVWRSTRGLGRTRTGIGREGLVGAVGVARTDLAPRGFVFVEGELWEAESPDGPVSARDRVEVLGFEGHRLLVRSHAGG
jgi:membrane-bound serine protease (ClpP class)